ncbi:glycerol-3-phosphate 1-O-acyltransferase PlsY [Acidisoma cellulosilytica]|uniref:Glycerol-3-phosphate acyltransferase n=1 Tax=Acidisoma cellulosilyticum TaxID=2802395 RepID=A0A964E2P9_9PROT|nr:glycerol-3-phosphate 1-O-acyltransferase PlsY [Acidisoma cellulosilyticum]MCB8879855.1 glycerol-3-phosphate 1-O-acyltransferase PlsY [Acidisoma cellulosilyticum]
MIPILPIILGYLLGSIPFGLIITRLGGAGDIRQVGSGNIGATNVLRTGRRGLAAATLLLDGLKGAAAVLAAANCPAWADHHAGLWAGLFAVIGHMFPVWLRFRGGKGVATGLGVALAACWPQGVLMCLIWLVGAKITKISSASALAAFVAAPFLAWIFAGPAHALLALLVTLLVLGRHHANIRRLISGTEPRIGAA